MKNLKRIVIGALLVPLFVVGLSALALPANAAGSVSLVALEVVGSSSAKADASSVVTFKATSYWNTCPTPPYWRESTTCDDGSAAGKKYSADSKIYITVSGSGNTVGTTGSDVGGAYVTSGADGMVIFTLKSSVAETKTVTAKDSNTVSASATFTAPTASTPPKSKTTTTTPTPVEPTPPEAPKAATLEVNGEAITAESSVFSSDQELTLAGTTVPNGVVKLFIFSTPTEASVTADAQGNWSYVVSGLEPGAHHVEAEVTDPATSKTSERATLAAFTVEAPPVIVAVVEQPKNDMPILAIVGAVALVLAASAAGGWWFWKRKHPKQPAPSTTTQPGNPNNEPPKDPGTSENPPQ